jgi:ribokinase
VQLRRVDTIILQFEIPPDTVYHTIRFARDHKIRCIVNPAPALPANLDELVGADYFIPNETEAELITGRPAGTVEAAGRVRRRCSRRASGAWWSLRERVAR